LGRTMRSSALGCLVLVCAVPFAAAQERTSAESYRAKYPGYDPFVTWAAIWGDTKREGVYTCEEWKQYATKVFNEADRNHDGYVDAQEFEAIRKADRMFRDADLAYFDDNRDGRLSRAEFVDKPNPFFARYDKKGTCRVTLDDISNVANAGEKPARSGKGYR
jgi:Ca2+-binding EF-hand superfamily protein